MYLIKIFTILYLILRLSDNTYSLVTWCNKTSTTLEVKACKEKCYKHENGLLFKKECRSQKNVQELRPCIKHWKKEEKAIWKPPSPQTVFLKSTGSRCILVTSYLPKLSPKTTVVMVNVTTRWEREEWACTSVGCVTLSCRPLLTRCKNSDAFSTVLRSKETERIFNWLAEKIIQENWQLEREPQHFHFPALLLILLSVLSCTNRLFHVE